MPDKFKGSLTAAGVRTAIAEGVRAVFPEADIVGFPASDGGDGFLEVVRAVREVASLEVAVEDPLGRELRAPFLLDAGTGEAFVEMARASGMELLEPGERNPLHTHTRGTGQLIREALRQGATRVYIGLGGSATNDGGCGIASVFGYRFLDAEGRDLEPVGGNLRKIARILPPADRSLLEKAELIAVNDVANPLSGPQGAARVYASQKGASPGDIELLDQGLNNLEQCVVRDLGVDAGQVAGAGAAGGTAYGLYCFLGARFLSGTEYVLRLTGATAFLREHPVDLICTGEGRIDAQTLHGKWIQGVLELAHRHGVPVLAVCGSCEVPRATLRKAGIREVLEVSDRNRPLAYNMEHAATLVRDSVRAYFQGWPHGPDH